MNTVLRANIERYGSIAMRWPPVIVIPECTDEQLEYLLSHGLFEAGCDDLFLVTNNAAPYSKE